MIVLTFKTCVCILCASPPINAVFQHIHEVSYTRIHSYPIKYVIFKKK